MPALASAQVAFVQAADDDPAPSTATSASATFANAQSAGDLNVIVVGWANDGSTVISVADSAGNSYALAVGTQQIGSGPGAVSQAIYYAKNIKLSASNTVTVTFNQSTSFPDVRALEYSGASATAPLDAVTGAQGSTSPASSGALTTSTAPSVLVVGGTTNGGFTQGADPQLNFTRELYNASTGNVAGEKILASNGPFTAKESVTGSWIMQMAAFGTNPPTVGPAPTIDPTTPVTPTTGSAAGGDSVKITGTNFVAGATVLFGGISAINCSVASSTEIDCTTPAHPIGDVAITVTNTDGGTVTTSNTPFGFTAVTPTINSITPTSGITNGGTSVSISGSNFVAGAKVTIGGIPASNVQVASGGTSLTAFTPAGSVGAVDVVVTNPPPSGGSATLPAGYTYKMGGGPVNFIQTANSGHSSNFQKEADAILSLAQNAGDTNIVVVSWGDASSHPITVSDSAGNTYTQANQPVQDTANKLGQVIFYAKNIKASSAGANTVKASFGTAGANAPDVQVVEYSGLDTAAPLDSSPAAANAGAGSGTTASAGAVSTTFNNNLVFAAASVVQFVSGAGSGFALASVSGNGNGAEHQFNGTPVSNVNPAIVIAPGAWVAQALVFHAPANLPPGGQQNFTFSASPSNQPVNPGSSAAYTLTVGGQNGFASAVSLSCAVPGGALLGCSVNPSSVTPGSGSATATLTVTTTGPSAALITPRNGKSLLPLYAIWLPLPGIALAGIGLGSRRRKLGIGLACFVVLGLTLLLAGCGGGGSSSGGGGGGSSGTPAGTYNITVTASSAGLSSQTQTVTLTVQ
ncbi:MAG TPA: IPT/TIG domain-containing protein [Terriglobales bacterium]|nr:IPT/TIG domain-containing protein [Terriglobales bacterium]